MLLPEGDRGRAVRTKCLLPVSDEDPVARSVAAHWGTPESTGAPVDGVPVRALTPEVSILRRAGLPIHDERLQLRLPERLRGASTPLGFPPVHRSEGGQPALTVHPLGDPGGAADVGGRPRALAPTSPWLTTDELRRVA